MENTSMRPIGGGGFGTIFLLPDGNVLKAIKGNGDCGDALREYNKQQKIYDCFERLRQDGNGGSSRLISLIKQYVVVSKPIERSGSGLVINDEFYSCSFKMTRLHGIPLGDLALHKNKILKEFNPHFLERAPPDYDIMVHLALNDDTTDTMVGANASRLIDEKNPARGYFIGHTDLLRNSYGLTLSDKEIKEMIGFIYGWIYYNAHIIPFDIEITIGLGTEGNLEFNVLDFGLAVDLIDTSNNNTRSFSTDYTAFKKDEIETKMKQDISYDFYADLVDDADNVRGFEAAGLFKLKEPSCSQCTRSKNVKLFCEETNTKRIFCSVDCQRTAYGILLKK